MKLLLTLSSTLFFISAVECYSQQKKVNVSTATPIVTTSPSVVTSSATSDALENRESFFAPINEGDINDALDLLGINIYNIKLPVIIAKNYKLTVYTDVYTQKQDAKSRKNTFEIVNDRNQTSKGLSLIIVKTGDSSLVLKWKVPDGSTRSSTNPRGRISGYEYRVLPFKFQEIIPGKKIPILLLGSSWFDPQINGVRFCYDLEMNPDLSNEVFTLMPQYYIFSIEISEIIN